MNPNPAGLDRCLGLGPPRHWGGGRTPQAAEYRRGSESSGNKMFVEDLGSFFFKLFTSFNSGQSTFIYKNLISNRKYTPAGVSFMLI